MTSKEYKEIIEKEETEYQLQCRIAQYLDNHPKRPLWTASCGGMRTSIGTAVKMKRSGYKKGCPDILIFEPATVDDENYYGLFIELKRKTGRASPEQIEFVRKLNDKGYFATTAFGCDDCIKEIDNYLR